MLSVLELQNIRSYKNGLFEFKEGVNIIVGPNASGKTNLLESIHMMARGQGFKSSDAEMLYYGEPWGRIDARIGEWTRTVKLLRDPPSKVFILDDVEKKRLSASQQLPVVLFEPGHMLLLGGEPERRRAYVDGVLTQTEATFSKVLTDYRRVLAQRNRLLKQERITPEHLFVWNLRLSELSAVLANRRAAYLEHAAEEIEQYYRLVSGGSDALLVRYGNTLPLGSYAEEHLKKLQENFELDHARGFTGSGPHREDVEIILNGSDARASASRGESRSIVLALKIVELERVGKVRGSPLLLLDDVFSELDGKRRRMLAEALRDKQTFITTTDADAIVKNFLTDYSVITMGA